MAADVTVTARINYNGKSTGILSDRSKELIPLVVTVNGNAVTDYTVALSVYGHAPGGSFLTPDSAGTTTGVLIGPGTSYAIGTGNYQVWVTYAADPETVVMPAEGWFQVTGLTSGGLPPGGGAGGAVDSVNTRTGAVVLTKADVGLAAVDNTSNATERAATATLANKSISGASNTLSNIDEGAVTGLVSDLAGKAATSHSHAEADVTGLVTDLAGKAPTTRTVAAGTGLTGGGDLSADRTLTVAYGTTAGTATQGNDSRVTGAAQKASNLADLASASTARTNLGLAAVAATGAYSDLTGTVPTAALPPLAISETTVVASQAAMLALTAERGDVAVRSDTGKTYILASDSPGTLADWKELLATGQVSSVAGRTGVVTLTKSDVGLGSVDNTADTAKPVSTAAQTALNLKAPLASPALTGTPTAPTAAPSTNTTQIATTAYADAAGSAGTPDATTLVKGKVQLAGDLAGTAALPTVPGLAAKAADSAVVHNTGAETVAGVKTFSSAPVVPSASFPESAVTNLTTDLAAKAPLASPALTGTPTAPTASAATNTTQIATTAYADAAVTAGATPDADATTKGKVKLTNDLGGTAALPTVPGLAAKAPLASPALTGTPTAPTATALTNTTQVATTAYTDAAVTAGAVTYGTPGSSAVADSVAAGAATTVARSDHRHGREAFGTPGSSAVADAAAAGAATTVARSDHTHGREAFASPGASAVADTTGAGSATTVARSDHRHAREAFGAVTANSGYNTASANGTATTVSHSDHNHGLPAIAEADVTNLASDLALKAPLASPALTGTPTAPTATANTNSTQVATTAYADGTATDDIQVFTSASGTWTKPAWVQTNTRVELIVIGDGAGGGSGCRRASAANRSAGGGGSAGAMSRVVYPASALASTMTIAVGQGGAGGAAKTTDNQDGAVGSAGTGSSVTSAGVVVAFAWQGLGGTGGQAGGGSSAGGSGLGGMFAGTTGGTSTAGAAGSGSVGASGASGGAAGGGISTSDVAFGGGTSGVAHSVSSAQSVGGVVAGASPTTAVNQAVGNPAPGTGGGGGAASATAAAQAGAVGGRYGGGGGGGGSSQNGFNSGAGGAGAPGIVYIITKR